METHTLTVQDIAAYIQSLIAEERAQATIEKYSRDIRLFLAWLESKPVTKSLAVEWREFLLAQGFSPVTVNAKLSAINGLFHFLRWDECRVKFLKIQRQIFREESRDLTQRDYKRLLSTASQQGRTRLELLMETICATGLRVSEVRSITVETAQAGRTEIHLKGKIRVVLLNKKLCRKLLNYAKREKITSGAIFRTRGGKHLSRHQIWREMKQLCKMAGVAPSKVFPHNLRHLFAVTLYQSTRDIVLLADLLGHSSINTTRIYLLSTGTEHIRRLERLGLVQ